MNGGRTAGDPFTKEIVSSYLTSTVHEMVKTTARAAYSPTFSEGLDFSCALFDVSGRMVTQAAGLGVHLGALRPVMRKIFETYDDFAEGDVLLTNDPYTATHQADIVAARPVYCTGRFVGFAVNIGHWNDIGGMAAGGCCGTSTHVVQDGLIIPVCKLYSAGVLQREIREFILANVRYPKEAWGDLQSQIAACRTAEARLRSLADRYGLEVVLDGFDYAIDHARERFLAKMAAIPDGVYTAIDYIEDDGVTDREYPIRVAVTKRPGGFVVDFDGTAPQAPTPINSNYSCTSAAVYAGIIAIVDPLTPMNEGVFSLIDVRAPRGTIVNAQWPVSVFGDTFEMSKRAGELMFRAFADAVPERVAAGGFSSGNNISARCVRDDGTDDTMWYYFQEGGQGARLRQDGNSAVYHWHGTPTNQPIEIWEHRYPVLFKKYALVADSGGAGTHRGGLGTVREVECLWDHFVSGLADRQRIAPWGLAGGCDAKPNRWTVVWQGEERLLKDAYGLASNSKFYAVPVKKGAVLVLESGGGGGFGDPLKRDRAAVIADLREGYISLESARRDYGLDSDDAGVSIVPDRSAPADTRSGGSRPLGSGRRS